eukprot:CAMPEP_0114696072 /NCGR_PEP_ID=MMETSP0191-20121206/72111_1 /TAXON_ID=126664 /ORGANISM="Sorites sp." /LENGTH=380 /DNA_ID=CAMNT_0001993187 /DNA_START=95 /DNA_END=1237 /DNA_ORIENTATION=+
MALLGSAFVAPSASHAQLPQIRAKTLEVSRSVAPVAKQAAPASGTTGFFSMAGVVAAAALLAGRRRSSKRTPAQGSAVIMKAATNPRHRMAERLQEKREIWNQDKGIPFNYDTKSLKLTPPRRPKKAMERRKELWLKYSVQKQAVMHALKSKYRARRMFKRLRRQQWIQRVGNNSKLHGIPYNQFICKMKEANININRKILSQLGVFDRAVFTNVVQTAAPDWKEIKEIEDNKGKTEMMTIEELDNIAIPYIEATVPEVYTDPTIRFNRQVKEWGVEYTIDVGDPEEWRDQLPKLPELANFQLPDHMLNNSRRQLEEIPAAERFRLPDESKDPKYAAFMDKVRAFQEDEKEKEEKGEAIRPKKEGYSRESWFDDEPQTWF